MTDVELGKERDEYPALARWIAQDPDDDPLVFRKFARLSARGLLHLQARLVDIEAQPDALDEEARNAQSMDVQEALQRWETLSEDARIDKTVEKELLRTIGESYGFLKEYPKSSALLDSFTIDTGADLPETNFCLCDRRLRSLISWNRVLEVYKDFLKGAALGATAEKPLDLISGRASEFLDSKLDLVTLQKPVETDHLSRLLRENWIFKKRNVSNSLDQTALYRNSHIARTVATLDLILAAVLLIGAIVTLYIVSSPGAKLGLVSMFTLLFAASIALCTNAKRAEVFAATAAYAAVLVVFSILAFASPIGRKSRAKE
ncbi:uncharacterized protein M421DRAFT_103513 [Didymella exigua CBS 183.55]|uniref:DUF6594 domain-containing protein n=1 Tax=Didymella exigua CBS 183.55 TaxID=1150837 RepID=A0A6A5RBP2_9PLEO|nr:uncharacterized protein M421DRAFT_103513 [Didymella exigua CBS 183.55]KAF1924769.1 hypothetical protein M421DRAFT_103513 [Didymella exigua CBS 183.55]